MHFLPGLASLAPQCDALLLDLWGCVHDGTAMYPGALDCLIHLHAADKRVIFLSNAPRRAGKAQAVLDALGVPRELYAGIVTSGEVAHLALAEKRIGYGPRYFFIGPERDADVLAGLPCHPVPAIAEADFILNCGFGTEAQSDDAWHIPLAEGAARGLPMLCLNPDREVVKITGEIYPCAGVLAEQYAVLGGAVRYFGKPYGDVYTHCLRLLSPISPARVLAAGDGLHTDILGARRAGLQNALITGGILSHTLGGASQENIRDYLSRQDVQPDYVMPCLRWGKS